MIANRIELQRLISELARQRWFFPLLVALITLATFITSIQNGFVNWDDDKLLLSNPHYRGLGLENLQWMFTTFHMGHYMPLTWLSFSLDYLVWEMNPAGYHLTNLLLHAANAVLFYLLTLRLLGKALPVPPQEDPLSLRMGVAVATLLFSVHPLRVEAVTWITARRDLLAGFFVLLMVLAYLKACEPNRRNASNWYWTSFALFGFSLLSKAIAVGAPLILLALDFYPLRRLGGRQGLWLGPTTRAVWIEKLPFLLLGAAVSVLALVAATQVSGNLHMQTWGITNRAAVASFSLVFYLWKTVFPFQLSPLYELPTHIDPLSLPYLLSAGAILTITVLAFLLRNRWPALPTVWLAYMVILIPVSGIFQTGPQMVADRYTYLSCLGWTVMVGGGVFWIWQVLTKRRPKMVALIPLTALTAILILQTLTVRQIGVWHDSIALWSQAVNVEPQSQLAHNNLGAALLTQGRIDEATFHAR